MHKHLAALSDRITALETVVHGRAVEYPVDPATDRRLTKRELATRRGKSTRQVNRDVESGILPPPEFENGRAYWWLSKLQRHERNRARKQQDKPRNPREAAVTTAT